MPERSIARHYSYPLRTALAATLLLMLCGAAVAQTPSNAERDAAEQRRIQEREAQLREQQEKARDIRLTTPTAQRRCSSCLELGWHCKFVENTSGNK
jgi:uncharacterized protein YlxW (UPF0749 family)